jgi:hypothetical protein
MIVGLQPVSLLLFFSASKPAKTVPACSQGVRKKIQFLE